ncbi:hypothetical protein LQV05_001841 [Cryptococcus neoformans]|nr:hypothetical protein LQV05_001841 [Cryptococcus neoformans]
MAPSTTISTSSDQQHSQTTNLQGSGWPAQSPSSEEFDQFGGLDFLPALTGDPNEEDGDSSGLSNDTTDVHNRDKANKIVRFLLEYADKDLLSQALHVGPEVRGQGSRKRRRQAEDEDVQATLSSREENNRNAEAIEAAVHYAFHLLVRVRQRKSKKNKLVWHGAEGIDLDDWPPPPHDGEIETTIECRGEHIQLWRPDWDDKKKNTAFFAALQSTVKEVLPSSFNYDEGLVQAKIDTYWNTRQDAWHKRNSGFNPKNAAMARKRTRLIDQRHFVDSAFRASIILPRCREYHILQRAVNASLLVPMLYDHADDKFELETTLQEGEEIGYKLFTILKSLSGLRKRDDEQCWAYEEQPWWSEMLSLAYWVLKAEYQTRVIKELFPLPAYLRSSWPSPGDMPSPTDVFPAMVNSAILADDRYSNYVSELRDDPPFVAGKPSLQEVLDLPEYRAIKERTLGFLRIPRAETGPFPAEYLRELWGKMRDVREEDLRSGEWDSIVSQEIAMHYR